MLSRRLRAPAAVAIAATAFVSTLFSPSIASADAPFSIRPLLYQRQPIAGTPGTQVGSFIFGRGLSDVGEITAWAHLTDSARGAGTMAAVRVSPDGGAQAIWTSPINAFSSLPANFTSFPPPAIGANGHVAFGGFITSPTIERSLFLAPPGGVAQNLLPTPFNVPAAGSFDLRMDYLLGIPGLDGAVTFRAHKTGTAAGAIVHRAPSGALAAPLPDYPLDKLHDVDPPSAAGATALHLRSLQSSIENEVWRVDAGGAAQFLAGPGTPVAGGTPGATLERPARVAVLADETAIVHSRTILPGGAVTNHAYFAARGDGQVDRVLGPGDAVVNQPGADLKRMAGTRQAGFAADGRGVTVATYRPAGATADVNGLFAFDIDAPGQARLLAGPGTPIAGGEWTVSSIYGTHEDREQYSQLAVSPSGFTLFRAMLRDADDPARTAHAYLLADLDADVPPQVVMHAGQTVIGGDGVPRTVESFFGHAPDNPFAGSFVNNNDDFAFSVGFKGGTSGVFLVTVPEPAMTAAAAALAISGLLHRRRRD
jgi:hypothetical protein